MNRAWMYERFQSNGTFNPEFLRGLNGFIDFVMNQPMLMDEDKVKCLCMRCDNIHYHAKGIVQYYIAKNGFILDYKIWRFYVKIKIPTAEYHNLEDIQYNQSTILIW